MVGLSDISLPDVETVIPELRDFDSISTLFEFGWQTRTTQSQSSTPLLESKFISVRQTDLPGGIVTGIEFMKAILHIYHMTRVQDVDSSIITSFLSDDKSLLYPEFTWMTNGDLLMDNTNVSKSGHQYVKIASNLAVKMGWMDPDNKKLVPTYRMTNGIIRF